MKSLVQIEEPKEHAESRFGERSARASVTLSCALFFFRVFRVFRGPSQSG
jgi:hypothetical protein